MIEQLKKEKLIVILRGLKRESILATVDALHKGGVRFIEVTFVQDDPESLINTPWAIRTIVDAFPDMYVGAGTVISIEQTDAAYEAGAKYIISPNTEETVIRRTVELGMLSIPGAFSPSEIVNAYNWGASFVKVFPAGDLGASYIKSVRAPIRHVPLFAVGGVGLDNMKQFYDAGICGFGIGSSIVKKNLIEKGDFDALTALAESYVACCARLGKE